MALDLRNIKFTEEWFNSLSPEEQDKFRTEVTAAMGRTARTITRAISSMAPSFFATLRQAFQPVLDYMEQVNEQHRLRFGCEEPFCLLDHGIHTGDCPPDCQSSHEPPYGSGANLDQADGWSLPPEYAMDRQPITGHQRAGKVCMIPGCGCTGLAHP